MTTYEIFNRPKPDSPEIVHSITFPDNQGSVVSAAAFGKSDDWVFDYTRLILHELAHQYGLDDCQNPKCIMRNHADRGWIANSKKFCPNCKEKLTENGWHIENW